MVPGDCYLSWHGCNSAPMAYAMCSCRISSSAPQSCLHLHLDSISDPPFLSLNSGFSSFLDPLNSWVTCSLNNFSPTDNWHLMYQCCASQGLVVGPWGSMTATNHDYSHTHLRHWNNTIITYKLCRVIKKRVRHDEEHYLEQDQSWH